MNTALNLLAGFGLGAGLMYVLDPQLGRRRRILMRDKLVRAGHKTEEGLCTLRHDLANRVTGLAAEAKGLFARDEPSDQVVTDRIRAHLGRLVSHPHAIKVSVQEGQATLSGPILAHEVERLVDCVSSVPGVQGVANRLDIHQERGRTSALQGGREHCGARSELCQGNWSPTTRFLVGMGGGALTVFGLTRSAPLACIVGTVGLALIASGLTNTTFRDVVDETRHLGERLAEVTGKTQHEDLLPALT